MLRSVKDLKGLRVEANDGEMGSVHDLLVDEDGWLMRYIVVDTGGWLLGRKVLIAPEAARWSERRDGGLRLDLTRQEVKDSPDISADPPISQETLARYHDYYHWPFAWGGSTGTAASFIGVEPAAQVLGDTELHPAPPPPPEPGESLLYTGHELIGYKVCSHTSEVGEVEDLILDTATAGVPSFVVSLEERRVLVPSGFLHGASLGDKTIDLSLDRDALENAPEYRTADSLPDEVAAAERHYHGLSR